MLKLWNKYRSPCISPLYTVQPASRLKQGWVNVFPHALPLFSLEAQRKRLITSRCVFAFMFTSTSCPMLLLRALLKMFPEGSLCSIGVALHCSEIDWLIMLSCKAKKKKKTFLLPSAEQRTAKLILSSKSQGQYIIHAFPCTVNRTESSIGFVETGRTSAEISSRILGVLSVSVHSQSGPEMKGVCCALEGTAEVSGLPCAQNKQHSCALLKSLSVSF